MSTKKKDIAPVIPAPDDYEPAETSDSKADSKAAYLLDRSLVLPKEDWTVGGKPIPEHLSHLVTWSQTDQGKAQADEGKTRAQVQVIRDEWDNRLDARANASEAWQGPDPLIEAVDKIRRDDRAYRLLSDGVCKKRGLRGWLPAKDERGDLIKVGNMFLGSMPADKRDQRNAHYAKLANEQQTAAQEQLRENQERAIHDSGKEGISILRPGEELRDAGEPHRGVTVGVFSTRGKLPATDRG